MTATKIKCPNCGKKIENWLVYCEYCGHLLDEKRVATGGTPTSNLKSNVAISSTTTDPVTGEKKLLVKVSEQKKQKVKWYTPPKRVRPGYHPLEWFFWIGWGIYIIFRFLGKELIRYFKWCCYWGPSKD